jgi:hypothetical protein
MATEAEAVTEVIRGAGLCSVCIARKAHVSPLTVLSALARIGLKYTHRVERSG